jgi:hypothetical protein
MSYYNHVMEVIRFEYELVQPAMSAYAKYYTWMEKEKYDFILNCLNLS